MQPPPKWHLARVGVLTWFVGALTGWMLASQGEPPAVVVPGASAITVVCDEGALSVRVEGREEVRFPPSQGTLCAVSAHFADGTSATTDSRVTLRGTQVCRVTGEVLRCASSWP